MKANKNLGQHFLIDENAISQIIELVATNVTDKHVIEIGPGTGAITKLLYPMLGEKLCCVELDKRCVTLLRQQFPNLTIHHEDFLHSSLLKDLEKEILLVGNFPYNISTEIVFKVIQYFEKIPVVVGMFQKEVAHRLAASSGSKVYGVTSVLIQHFYDVTIEFNLPASAFHPAPKVESSVLTMKRKTNIPSDIEYKRLALVVKTAFNQRRKTLKNALSSISFNDDIANRYFTMRAEQLNLSDYYALVRGMK